MSISSGVGRGPHIARGVMLVVAGAVALFNGWERSPIYDSVAYLLYLATRNYPLVTAARLSHVAPFAIAILTLLIAGVPAAIYERIRGLRTSTPVSVGIWLAGAILLTLPAILVLFGSD